MKLRTVLLGAVVLFWGWQFQSQVQAQCWTVGISPNSQPVCPGDIVTYTLTNYTPPAPIRWELSLYGQILSGQGTPTLTVQYNHPVYCPSCSTFDFQLWVEVDYGNCIDYNYFNQPYASGSLAPPILGATTPHAGDTCWYLAEYFNPTSGNPYGQFSGLQGGTVIRTITHNGMSWVPGFFVQDYLQIVWGPQGSGSISYTYYGLPSYCPHTGVKNISIGPPGSLGTRIIGPEYVCVGDTAIYKAPFHPGSTYLWEVQGGFIVSYPAPNEVEVAFPSPLHAYQEQSSIMVTETNNGRSRSNHKQVGHASGAYSVPFLLRGPASICGSAPAKYHVSAQMDSYSWNVPGGTILSGQGTDTILVQWPFFASGQRTVSVYCGSSLCQGISRTKSVTLNSGMAPYPQLLVPNTASVGPPVTYGTPFNAGHSYAWSVSPGGTILSGQGSNIISVQWNQFGAQTVSVSETGPLCGTLSSTANVNVTGLAVEVVATDSSLQTGYGPQQCATLSVNGTAALGNPTYAWSTGATTPTITVCPNTTTTYSVTVTDPLGTASDDVLIEVENVSCGNGGVKVCRNFGMFSFTQCVQPLLVPSTLAQGGSLGTCASKTGPQAARSYGFDIVPNPASERARVLLGVSEAGLYGLDLLDAEGRVLRQILRQELPEGSFVELELLREELPNGMYFLRLSGQGVFEVKKWLLQ